MVHFVGAGPGAPDLITLRGAELLKQADVIIYAGSLVNPALLDMAREDCEIHNSAKMTLEQVIDVMKQAEAAGKTTVRLHTGDPCVYGAIREQMPWTSWAFPMTTCRASPASAARRRPCGRNTRCPASARASSSPGWRAVPRCRMRRVYRLWQATARPWQCSSPAGCWAGFRRNC